MTEGIYIGKFIYAILKGNNAISTSLTSAEGKLKIFPLVANSNVTLPYITYKKDNLSTVSNKDGWESDKAQFTIAVCDKNYDSGCDIAQEIRKSFTFQRCVFGNMEILNSQLVSMDEAWASDAYVQILTFSCEVYKR